MFHLSEFRWRWTPPPQIRFTGMLHMSYKEFFCEKRSLIKISSSRWRTFNISIRSLNCRLLREACLFERQFTCRSTCPLSTLAGRDLFSVVQSRIGWLVVFGGYSRHVLKSILVTICSLAPLGFAPLCCYHYYVCREIARVHTGQAIPLKAGTLDMEAAIAVLSIISYL